MEALDLRIAPPRGPRERLAELVFLPRAIDKLRATLPGGDPGEYFPYTGLSALFAHLTRIDLKELREVVAAASCDDDVAVWVQQRVTPDIIGKTNHVMSEFTQDKIPPDFRMLFDSVAPAHLRAKYSKLFDVLEADDRLSFQGVAEG